ncbi:MAG: bifunctional alpha/beta hydrolase/class I SAM-dependent methyltransferase [Xanthomonadaceae bacterium]|nr:bifunctional alpha/beta hydrolase/class I SAM-dependent methyltransferase [Xanthomonadaceae bacterium]
MSESRPCQEGSFSSHDGVALFYRHWPAARATDAPARAVVLVHRGHEHSGRMAHLADELNLPDFDVFAYDMRGHGRSPGVRGDSPSFGHSVRDLDTFVAHIADAHGIARGDVVVIAQSVGAVLASTWAHDYAPKIRGLVLASPAFKVKLYVPFARPGLALLHKLRGNFFVNSYVKAKFLTHDPERIASYDADPLISRPISVRILLGLYAAADRVVADAAAIALPVQLLISGSDWVVHHAPQHRFFERLSHPRKEKHEFPGFFHDTLGERDRAQAVEKIHAFVRGLFDDPPAPLSLLDAHRRGATFDEAQALAKPLPWYTPRGAYWAFTRTSLKFGGLLSRGIALGHATGFDSGSTLDYVYKNQAQGVPLIGTAIDRTYLDSIGWRGIRVRKTHVEALLRAAFARVRAQGLPLRVMDVAAGHGRYVLDAIAGGDATPDAQLGTKPESILLRDYSDINVRDGRALIAERGLGQIARFEQGDAFDRDDLASVTPAPTVAVVSGLYELFPDNDAVARSLAGIAAAVPPGGCLVYTGQPWHPQLELIARALTSHRQGQAWVMRRRTQAEMDQLVEAAGFRKVEQRIDEWGIFTVSLAVREG